MRRIAFLIVAVGLSVVGTTPAEAQLPQVPLPDVQLPDLEVPGVELPELPGEDGGASDPDSPVETPSINDGSASGGSGGWRLRRLGLGRRLGWRRLGGRGRGLLPVRSASNRIPGRGGLRQVLRPGRRSSCGERRIEFRSRDIAI